jgi:WD40 repeat protein
MNSDGSDVQRVTRSSGRDGYPAWSPDGERIVFQSERDGNWEIYQINKDGSEPIRLTNDPADDQDPHWSPDGERIVFQSERDGNLEIYRMDSEGNNIVRLTNNPLEDQYPAWSPDGQFIAYSSMQDGNFEVFVMNADGSEVIQITQDPPENAWDDTYPTWSPGNFTFTEEPWFGPPFLAKDSDGDFQPDTITDSISVDDLTAFVFFPYQNMEDGMPWHMDLIYEGSEYSTLLSWDHGHSGLYSGFIPITPQTPTSATIQLIVNDKILQEVSFEIVK